jgi:5'-phosphate synthase pdxT subunit
MPQTVGVVALQGDFAKHIEAFAAVDSTLATREVRTPEDLVGVDRIVIPGGESTTVGMLMERFGLGQAIRERARAGMPVWGTCMGMIIMAGHVEGRQQYSLELLDITVRRNAFGAQIHSFEDTITVDGVGDVMGVFIRAPIVTRKGADVQELATYRGSVVAVRQGQMLGTSFHPELTDDRRVHAWFLSW